ncbi:MAG: hypothetical protein HQK65_14300, partial [Desulfamplus sp.]|nr:hypothetical protein [Desulfamplus sp.]
GCTLGIHAMYDGELLPLTRSLEKELIPISSEDVGLNRLFPGRALKTVEPPPFSYGMWTRNSKRA